MLRNLPAIARLLDFDSHGTILARTHNGAGVRNPPTIADGFDSTVVAWCDTRDVPEGGREVAL
jgi:hypothetical protein